MQLHLHVQDLKGFLHGEMGEGDSCVSNLIEEIQQDKRAEIGDWNRGMMRDRDWALFQKEGWHEVDGERGKERESECVVEWNGDRGITGLATGPLWKHL